MNQLERQALRHWSRIVVAAAGIVAIEITLALLLGLSAWQCAAVSAASMLTGVQAWRAAARA